MVNLAKVNLIMRKKCSAVHAEKMIRLLKI